MAILLRIGAFLLGLYLLAMLAMFLLQSRLIYHPDTRALTPQQAGLAGFSAVHIKTGDLTLTSWWHPPSGDGQPVIVYMHGNGGALAGRAALYRELAASGAGVLAVGYPGYGGNPGKPSEESLVDAASYNYAWLAEQGYPDARIVIAGQSLGTGPAVWLATRHNARGLILEAPFTSMIDMARRRVPFFPVYWLVNDSYDSVGHIAAITMPLVWIHGEDDALIPVAMGQRLFDAAPKRKCAFRIPGAGHNDLWQHGAGGIVSRQAAALVKTGECRQG